MLKNKDEYIYIRLHHHSSFIKLTFHYFTKLLLQLNRNFLITVLKFFFSEHFEIFRLVLPGYKFGLDRFFFKL